MDEAGVTIGFQTFSSVSPNIYPLNIKIQCKIKGMQEPFNYFEQMAATLSTGRSGWDGGVLHLEGTTFL